MCVCVAPSKSHSLLMLFYLFIFLCRKYPYRLENHVCYSPRYVDIDAEIASSPRNCGNPRYLRRLLKEQDRIFELERRRLAVLQISQKSLSTPPHFGVNMNGSRVSNGMVHISA
jgi:hypothetical protein